MKRRTLCEGIRGQRNHDERRRAERINAQVRACEIKRRSATSALKRRGRNAPEVAGLSE